MYKKYTERIKGKGYLNSVLGTSKLKTLLVLKKELKIKMIIKTE